jgi:hypothetical protein
MTTAPGVIEWCAHEDTAVERLRLLNKWQDTIERRKALRAEVPPSWWPVVGLGSTPRSSLGLHGDVFFRGDQGKKNGAASGE